MKFFVPVVLASAIFMPAVLALPFSTARTNSIVARELSAPSVFLVTREELEQLLFERGGASSTAKEALGLPLNDEDKAKLDRKNERKLREANERHALRTAQIESGGKRHHKLETTWADGAPGRTAHEHQAEKEVKNHWKNDKDLQKFKHAQIQSSEISEQTGQLHTSVFFHHNDGHPGGHVMLMSKPKTR